MSIELLDLDPSSLTPAQRRGLHITTVTYNKSRLADALQCDSLTRDMLEECVYGEYGYDIEDAELVYVAYSPAHDVFALGYYLEEEQAAALLVASLGEYWYHDDMGRQLPDRGVWVTEARSGPERAVAALHRQARSWVDGLLRIAV